MQLHVSFEVQIPESFGATLEEATEWIRFELGEQDRLSPRNPLSAMPLLYALVPQAMADHKLIYSDVDERKCPQRG